MSRRAVGHRYGRRHKELRRQFSPDGAGRAVQLLALREADRPVRPVGLGACPGQHGGRWRTLARAPFVQQGDGHAPQAEVGRSGVPGDGESAVVIRVVCAADGCSSTFVPNRRGRPRLYCPDCSTQAAYNRRWRAGETHAPTPGPPRVKLLPRERVCKDCGVTFTQTKPHELYCSRECCPPTGAKVMASCERCGREFEARVRDRERGWGRFCSKSCARSSALEARRQAVAA
jgi:hypothetical protein